MGNGTIVRSNSLVSVNAIPLHFRYTSTVSDGAGHRVHDDTNRGATCTILISIGDHGPICLGQGSILVNENRRYSVEVLSSAMSSRRTEVCGAAGN